MGYKVKLNIFEGPFDLLVYLIENAQMSIYDIKIAEITEQYMGYINKMKDTEVSVATEFMVLAAELIEIKSKMLLPRMSPDGDGVVEEDPRDELVEKLVEYKRFKLLAHMLELRNEEESMVFEKPKEDISQYTNEPDEYLSLDLKQFVSAFDLFLRKKQKVEEINKNYARIEKQRMSVEARTSYIKDFFRQHRNNKTTFSQLVSHGEDNYDVALTFVSVLEMIKERRLNAEQKKIYGEILLKATADLEEGITSEH